MITADVYVTGIGAGGLSRDVRVTVRSDADGIGSVELRDRSGVPFAPPGLLTPDCSRALSFDVSGIPTGQFPLFVWASECANGQPSGETLPLGPFLPNGSPDLGSGPQPPPMCPPPIFGVPPSPQCLAVRNEAGRIRNDLIAICNRIHALRSRRDSYTARAVALSVLAAAFFGVFLYATAVATGLTAVPFVAVIAAVLFAVALVTLALAMATAAAATIFAGQAAALQREVSAAERELETTSERFRAAAMAVRTTCCDGDYVEDEVTLPSC